MIKFLKSLPYGKAIPLYIISFVIVSTIGLYQDFGWFGLELSLPIVVTFLIIDLSLTYIRYVRNTRV